MGRKLSGRFFFFTSWFTLLATMTLPIACTGQQYSTDELLEGKFGTDDFSPVDLLSPVRNSSSAGKQIFTWTKRNGARQYLLEIAAQTDFATVVLKQYTQQTSYELSASDLIGITQLDPITYYWRITTIYANQETRSDFSVFHVLEDTIVYVDANSTAAAQIGNKTSPFKTIGAAVETANLIRNEVATTAMTIAVAQGTYNESVALRPGISIKGGYESSGWTRSTATYTTTINGPVDSAVRGDSTITGSFTSTTVVDGFTLNAGNAPSNYGIYLVASSPTITNNTINGGQGTFSNGILTGSGGNPVIMNNTFNGGSGSTSGSYGLYLTGGSPRVTNNLINGGTGTTSVGIHNRTGSRVG